MPALKAAAPAPQLHSPDGRVRLKASALRTIVLEHVCTVQDLAVLDDLGPAQCSARAGGITEWQGRHDGRVLSLGWDWVWLDDGALVAPRTAPPRSNLMLLDPQGYDTHPAELDEALRALINRLAWQETARRALEDCP